MPSVPRGSRLDPWHVRDQAEDLGEGQVVRVTESEQRPPGRRPQGRSVCQRCGHYFKRHGNREPFACLMCGCKHFRWREDGAEQLPMLPDLKAPRSAR